MLWRNKDVYIELQNFLIAPRNWV